MTDYKKLYFLLFNEISSITDRLLQVQQKAEELYMHSKDTDERPQDEETAMQHDPIPFERYL